MNYANTSFDVSFGREPSAALASALEKRCRRDVCACVPYSLLGELRTDVITESVGSPLGAYHLTTIRRKSVSPISVFAQEALPIKRRHEFFIIGAG